MEPNRIGPASRRLIAGALDLFGGLALGVVFANTPIGFFFASRAVVMLRIGAPDTVWRGPIPMLMGIAGTFVHSLPFAFLIVAISRALLDRSSSSRDVWRRTLIWATPWWGLTLALLTGSWVLAVMFSIAGLLLAGRAVLSLL